jgi:predicted small lipoprotein YifL
MIRPFIAISAIALLAAPLGACGKQGDLERPAPLWGARAKAEYEAQKRQQADTKTNEAQGNQIETLPDEGPGSDPYTNPAPPRAQPIQGQTPSPTAGGQPGALPDPYARPQ